ncbi:NorD nitric oxide reductase activation protein [Frigidibacter mobilis]|uniref:NorD nitric oxide reductase activation protein n=1 Tax=Frigidibacter mobilis TaxID=1335048 RepID=A0A159Z388_9RHOB|nr:NorD nitric oxide reductase activation protein [Frigidibacter mobilis]
MALHPMDLMEPEETVGNLWHGLAQRLAPLAGHEGSAVTLEAVRPSVTLLFRALGGQPGVEVAASPATASRHRRGLGAHLAEARVLEHVARFDGASLRLPPGMDAFPSVEMNRAAYLWLAALAALAEPAAAPADPLAADLAHLAAMQRASARVLARCPGLRAHHAAMCAYLAASPALAASAAERRVADLTRKVLAGEALPPQDSAPAPRGYAPLAPLPIWLRLDAPGAGASAAQDGDAITAPPGLASATRKQAMREENEQANRTDSFIMHRFESILSWVESMGLNRATDDDDLQNAQRAAEDQDHIALTRHHKRAATRLRLHLDLAPQDAEHERLSDRFIYPEWNHRARAYMPDHCRVLEAEAAPGSHFAPPAADGPGAPAVPGAAPAPHPAAAAGGRCRTGP